MALDDPHARPPVPHPAGEPGGGPSAADDVPPLAGDEVLPCGRLLSRVWEQAQDTEPGADSHTAACPYCREAVEGLTVVNRAALRLRDEAPLDLQALVDRVMNVVGAEARLGRLLPLADPDRDLRIAESAAAKVLRQAADRVPGARAASCRLEPEGEGTDVRVTMTLAATLDTPLPDRVHQVRLSVLDSAARDLGLAVTDVDITVVDVLEPSALGPALPAGGGAR
ncbi:hypothetical protein ACWCQ1_07860 [Streptomyces sp. NPDC002144]|uniref:hypothetical protein n=1 Tax=Streptomyces sp. NPDC006668 TaxID=3156903 RepID=UPI0033FE15C7